MNTKLLDRRVQKLEKVLIKNAQIGFLDKIDSDVVGALVGGVICVGGCAYFGSQIVEKLPVIYEFQGMGPYLQNHIEYLDSMNEGISLNTIDWVKGQLSEHQDVYTNVVDSMLTSLDGVKRMINSGASADVINSEVKELAGSIQSSKKFSELGLTMGALVSGYGLIVSMWSGAKDFVNNVNSKKKLKKQVYEEFPENMKKILEGPFSSQSLTLIERTYEKLEKDEWPEVIADNLIRLTGIFAKHTDKEYAPIYEHLINGTNCNERYMFVMAFKPVQ